MRHPNNRQPFSTEVGPERTLLVVCHAFRGDGERFANLTVRKLPNAILDRCEWGRDDYSLKIAALGGAPVEEPAPATAASAPPRKKPGRKPKESAAQPDLFAGPAKDSDEGGDQ